MGAGKGWGFIISPLLSKSYIQFLNSIPQARENFLSNHHPLPALPHGRNSDRCKTIVIVKSYGYGMKIIFSFESSTGRKVEWCSRQSMLINHWLIVFQIYCRKGICSHFLTWHTKGLQVEIATGTHRLSGTLLLMDIICWLHSPLPRTWVYMVCSRTALSYPTFYWDFEFQHYEPGNFPNAKLFKLHLFTVI